MGTPPRSVLTPSVACVHARPVDNLIAPRYPELKLFLFEIFGVECLIKFIDLVNDRLLARLAIKNRVVKPRTVEMPRMRCTN